MKPLKPLIVLLLALTTVTAEAEPIPAPVRYDPGKEAVDIFVDMFIIRPVALAATIAGTGLFIGLSPFTGLLTIRPPHDAIIRAGNAFVGLPACYAFGRQLGDLSAGQNFYRPDGTTNWCTW
ncbi:MAG: hypothetical protein H6R26_2302 [Proteobacteria bacterium]|nr:hypothetical protein [Pseudomonadota bacterium]